MDGVTWVITVGVALKLPYPIILGLDWTEFTRILHTTSLWDLPEQMALEGDPLEGRLRYAGRLTQATHQPHVGGLSTPTQSDDREAPLNMGVDFSRNQREDSTLSWTYKQLAYMARAAMNL